MFKIIICTVFLSVTLSVFAQNSLLQSGPMVGYCEMTVAMIWVQTNKAAAVKISYHEIDKPSKIFFTDSYTSLKDNGYTCHLVLDKITEGKKYKYSVFIDNKKVILPYETSFSSKKLWHWRTDAPDFTVAVGSCNYIGETAVDRPGKSYGSGYEIYSKINDKSPDIMVWGGDNIYLREADWDSKTGIYHRNTHSRSIKEMQPLLAKTQHFAIWDDHDFGPNDGDRGFYNKYLTQQAFKDFWANKTYGSAPSQQEGIYSTFNWGDVQFFLLDNRFFKSPNDRKTGKKILLGDEQLNWLIDNLASSNASFKIICIGGQVLNTAEVFENYSNYADEKAVLLKEIQDNKIKGVLFISGDRHHNELSQMNRDGAYPLLDWTVSPLTSGAGNLEKVKKEDNKNRVEGSLFAQNAFGIISFSGNKENRQLKLTLFDREGAELWNKVVLKKELE